MPRRSRNKKSPMLEQLEKSADRGARARKEGARVNRAAFAEVENHKSPRHSTPLGVGIRPAKDRVEGAGQPVEVNKAPVEKSGEARPAVARETSAKPAEQPASNEGVSKPAQGPAKKAEAAQAAKAPKE